MATAGYLNERAPFTSMSRFGLTLATVMDFLLPRTRTSEPFHMAGIDKNSWKTSLQTSRSFGEPMLKSHQIG